MKATATATATADDYSRIDNILLAGRETSTQ